MYTMEILKQLDRLEFDFFDHTSYSTIPFYHYHKKFLYIHMYQLCRRPRPGGRFSFRYRIKDTDKKAWYDQNIEFWLYRYYIYMCTGYMPFTGCHRVPVLYSKSKLIFFRKIPIAC